MEYTVIRYFHFLGIFVLFAMLTLEHVQLKREMTIAEVKKIAFFDAIYGVSATVVLLTGLSLWFLVGKPAEFYSSNPVFHAKVALFLTVAAISIYPTLFFIKNRRSSAPIIKVPKAIIMCIRIELLLLLVIPLLAVIMAQGIGLG
ncbi:MAG TPA: DUF2214 family protein [Gammaproteobacteria bacterium]|nr:DUF2214 family protein [Gammaproteobacteria bacterium]